MSVAGSYECVTKTPMGPMESIFTVTIDGASFTGTNSASVGSMDVIDGKVDGQTLTWKMEMTKPMPMKLDCKATVDGDKLTGSVKAGVFGSFPMIGTKVG